MTIENDKETRLNYNLQNVCIIISFFLYISDEARNKGSAVLVHCLAGVSRSVTVTLAYLIQTEALSLNEAFTLVRSRKPDVSPNFHFMQQLNTFEQEIRGLSKKDSLGQQCISKPLKKHAADSLQNNLSDRVVMANKIGVSPDSGIEFDRWTSTDITKSSTCSK